MSYLAFFAPGLLAASAMQTGFIEGSGRVAMAAAWAGPYRAAATTPLEPSEILGGHLLFIAFRVLSSSAAFVAVMAAFGASDGWWALAVLPAALLTGLAFAAPAAAWAVGVRFPRKINTVFRFVIMPMYMFSGTFFATSQLPRWLRVVVEALPLWQGVAALPHAQPRHRGRAWRRVPRRVPACPDRRWRPRRAGHLPPQAARVSSLDALRAPIAGWKLSRTLSLVERNFMIYRRSITPLLSSMVEPVLYLLSIGIGVGMLVGTVPGVHVRYAAFVAPAILATTAMNTAMNQTSFGVFSRIKNERTYDAIVPTPLSVTDIALGEVLSAVIYAVLSSASFVLVMTVLGLVSSPGILLAIPGAILIGYAFAAAGLAVTTYLRDFSDFQLIQLVMLPMYLFATTFYPLTTYPAPVRPLIQVLPLYQSIQLVREPALGVFTLSSLVPVVYLSAFGTIALGIATRRMTRMLLH